MVFKRFLNPIYLFYSLKLTEGDTELALQSFKNRGARVHRIEGTMEPELEIESFLASSFGKYVYLIRIGKGIRYLAMGEENIMERKWRPQSYLVRDENGLKRLIVKEISPFRTLPWKTLYLVLWIGLWFLLWEKFTGVSWPQWCFEQ